ISAILRAMSSSIFNLFGQSPIRPLQKHMAKAHACAEALTSFFDYVMAHDWKKAADIQKKISIMEKEADVLKKDLRLHMPKGMFMPVPRADILDLLTTQDKIANQAKD